jgi:P-type conjugative transfer protein TrbJ
VTRLLLVLCLSLPAPPSSGFSLGGLFGGGAGAGGMVVYDPTNHLETAVSAAEAVRQTALQVRAEIQRLQALAIELQQLRTLPEGTVSAGLRDWSGQLAVLVEAGQALQGLAGELDTTRGRFALRLREIAALGLSPEAYLAREVQLASLHHRAHAGLLAADRQSLQSLQGSIVQLNRLQAQIPASSGVHQSLQTTNQYLDLLAGQTGQLLQLTAAQASAGVDRQQGQDEDAALADSRESERLGSDLQRIAALRAQLRERDARQGWGVLRPVP